MLSANIRHTVVVCFTLAIAACGGSKSPTNPTPPPLPNPTLGAPQLLSPGDDEQLDTLRPQLVVNNATSDRNGNRTYEFQVAEAPDFPGEGLITKSEPEADGTTAATVDEDLKPGRRYYWRVRGVQDPTIGPWSEVRKFITRLPSPNAPPRIVAITSSLPRLEVDREVTLTATVIDAETPPDQLTYAWTAPAGTFLGAGPVVQWRAPTTAKTPITYDLTLTVTERYRVTDPDGVEEMREHKTAAAVAVDVNDSPAEVTDLTLTFLADFSDSAVSPATCVRNFSDTCTGKQAELNDITYNRDTREILSSRYRMSELVLEGYPPYYANITAVCEFTSRVTVDVRENGKLVRAGTIESVTGDCLLTGVYHSKRWWLCDSHFRGRSTTTGLRFPF